MTLKDEMVHRTVSKSGAEYSFTISDPITPEEVLASHSAFVDQFNRSDNPRLALQFGAEHAIRTLSNDGEVTFGKLHAELFSQLILFSSRDELDPDVRAQISGIVCSFSAFLNFMDQSGLSEIVMSNFRPFIHKVVFSTRTSIGYAEDLGHILTQLSETGRRVSSRRDPVLFYQLDTCERRIVGLLHFTGKPTVIKLTNSCSESQVATYAGSQGLGPVVYESTPSMIAEEWIEGVPIMRYRKNPKFVGREIGKMISALHRRGIVYDNRFLDHVLLERRKGSRGRIIDLESAGFSGNFDLDLDKATIELKRFYRQDAEAMKAAQDALSHAYAS